MIRKRRSKRSSSNRLDQIPKLCGADLELGNFVLGGTTHGTSCLDAARALLREIHGCTESGEVAPLMLDSSWRRWQAPEPPGHLPMDPLDGGLHGQAGDDDRDNRTRREPGAGTFGQQNAGTWTFNSRDWGRKFLPSNGGCVYIDLGHLEICIPEVLSAFDHVACTHAMLRIARQAQMDANDKRAPAGRIEVLANNSDGQGHSYGSHLNFLITRRSWNSLFQRKMQHLLYLASHQVSSIVYAGQGKVGSENGRPPVDFQISARSDFFETLVGEQTTYHRPLVNSRDEALCRASPHLARVHCIFYDHNLCHVSSLLKVGCMQLVLAMIERERINLNLILEDPLTALVAWSRDLTFRTRARTLGGRSYSPVELQWRFLVEATRFVESGCCDGIVPHARDILRTWESVLRQLQAAADAGNTEALEPLAGRVDWVLKHGILRRALERHPHLTWSAPELKHLDHVYSSLSPNQGLFWAYETEGLVDAVVTEAEIERFIHEPPPDTRAWTRAMLLRRADEGTLAGVAWDSLRFRLETPGFWLTTRDLDLDDPLGFTRAVAEPILRSTSDLARILDALESARGAWPDEHGSSPEDGAAPDGERSSVSAVMPRTFAEGRSGPLEDAPTSDTTDLISGDEHDPA